ncbi:MAG: cyclic pyranopterin monophosphate synthase MoaC [Defluviitaleaceae bacterium]|nr:cyclic pyranopterin monophosphate synthase MoaC [Defluviitaleaceae bacterium]
MSDFTHFNQENRARMVDVTGKPDTIRTATAKGEVTVNDELFKLIADGGVSKGDVLGVAQVAGIMGAKRAADIIPMCHPIGITGADISFELDAERNVIGITAKVTCAGATGVEMEALTAVSVAVLTIYDMCKAVQRDIVIGNVRLVEKTSSPAAMGGGSLYRS